MVLMLIALLVVISVVLVISKRNTESFLIFGLSASLFILWFGTLTNIAKKGGISNDMQLFLYLTNDIKLKLQYLMVTLGQLGYTVAIGRYLFPLFLIELALHYSMSPKIRTRKWLHYAVMFFPVLSLILYHPKVFEFIIEKNSAFQHILVQGTRYWIVIYIVISISLFVYEYINITINFSKRQFLHQCIMIFSLTILFLLYYQQDPAQIYLFYRSDYMWLLGLSYLSPRLSILNYIAALSLAFASSVVGFTSLLRYTHRKIQEDQNDTVLQRKFDAASAGVSVFVHSIKNQLLTNRILHKRLKAMSTQQPTDVDAMIREIELLQTNNEMMISHMETLYSTVKTRSLYLTPISLGDIVDEAMEAFLRKYPKGKITINVTRDIQVLADQKHISAAIYNLLTNGWEASLETENNLPIQLNSHQERLYTVFEVKDFGLGIERSKQNKIFEPFYSSKNSNYNWGMGLHYTQSIVKSHLGNIWIESKVGEGTQIFVSLPRYDLAL